MGADVFAGITVTVPDGAVCGLYPGVPAYLNYFNAIDPKKAIAATKVVKNGQTVTYHYEHLKADLYHCGISMEGYNALCQMINYTGAHLHLDITLDKLAGNGYEAGYVTRCTREYIGAHMISRKDAWGIEYEKLFRTPQFLPRPGHGLHQQTTNEEVAAFIAKLSQTSKNMYVFSLGKSPKYGFDMPLVLFTRENAAGLSLEDAAGLVRSNGKPTIQYTAQCHSTEPASGEGALAMMGKLCGDYGKEVLDGVDIYVIPRINPDGALDVMRHAPATNDDMNRDYLRLHNRETEMVVGAYNLFLPEIAIDGHEKQNDAKKDGNSLCTDIELQVGAGSLNHPAAMTELAMKMALKALKNAKALGLRGHFYDRLASAAGGSAGSSYFGCRNSLSFLVETPGQVAAGMEFMERRVLGQYVLASTGIDYAVENAEQIMATVHSSRKEMLQKNAVYDENNRIVLKHENAVTGSWKTPLIHVPTGAVVDAAHSEPYKEQVQFSLARPRATAYLLPLELNNEDEILRVTGCHAIRHYKLPAGSKMKVRQYLELNGETSLTEEKTVCFEAGALVFPNTVPSTILGMIMEPDYNRAQQRKMTLLSMGLIEPDAKGLLPLYRYCHDLKDGKAAVE